MNTSGIVFTASVVSLTLAACAAGPFDDYEVQIDARFDTAQREQIVSALTEWDGATGGRVHFYTRPVNGAPEYLLVDGIYIARYDGTCPAGKDLRDYDEPKIGFYTKGLTYHALGGHVECLDTDTDHFRRLVLHETGHVLGLKHTEGVPSVMRVPLGAASDFVTSDDTEQFCDLAGC